jgi:hypothetical protein
MWKPGLANIRWLSIDGLKTIVLVSLEFIAVIITVTSWIVQNLTCYESDSELFMDNISEDYRDKENISHIFHFFIIVELITSSLFTLQFILLRKKCLFYFGAA